MIDFGRMGVVTMEVIINNHRQSAASASKRNEEETQIFYDDYDLS
jgi:hypothetical protein